MEILTTEIPDVLILEPALFGDARGFFTELYQSERYATAGIDQTFVQDNLSRSRKGVLRGLHFQNPQPQGKLVSVLRGSVLDVAVDVRVGESYLRPSCEGGVERAQSPAVLGASWLCAWFRGVVGVGGFLLQMRCAL